MTRGKAWIWTILLATSLFFTIQGYSVEPNVPKPILKKRAFDVVVFPDGYTLIGPGPFGLIPQPEDMSFIIKYAAEDMARKAHVNDCSHGEFIGDKIKAQWTPRGTWCQADFMAADVIVSLNACIKKLADLPETVSGCCTLLWDAYHGVDGAKLIQYFSLTANQTNAPLDGTVCESGMKAPQSSNFTVV